MANPISLEDQIANEQVLKGEVEDVSSTEIYDANLQTEINRALELAIGTGQPLDVVKDARSKLDTTLEQKALASSPVVDVNGLVDKGIENGISAEDLATVIRERNEKKDDMSFAEFSLLQSLVATDDSVNAPAARTLANMDVFDKMIQKRLEADESSTLSKVGQFLDIHILRQAVIGNFEDITYSSNRSGEAIREAFNTLPADDFKLWAEDFIEAQSQEGVFTEDSIFNLYRAVNDRTYLGDDPLANVDAAFGAIEIVPVAGTILSRVGKAGTSALRTARALKALNKGIVDADSIERLTELANARLPVDKVAVVRGEVEAAEVLARNVEAEGVHLDAASVGRQGPEALDPVAGPDARPAGPSTRFHGRRNALIEAIEDIRKRGTFGRIVSDAEVAQEAARIAARIADSVNDVVVNTVTRRDEGSEDFVVTVRMGKSGTGSAFRRKMDAEAVAAQDPSLYVVKRDDGRGWFVETEQRIDILGMPEAAQAYKYNNIVSDAISKVFGASTRRLSDKVGAMFLQAEAGLSLLPKIAKPYLKSFNSLKGADKEELSSFFEHLRDGDLSHLREAPDTVRFKSLYKTMYKRAPSKQTVKAYEDLQVLNDASWHMKSEKRLKDTVAANGVYAELADGYGDVAYKVDQPANKLADDDMIYDIATGRSIPKTDLGSDQLVFKVPSIFEGHMFVTNVKRTRVLERVDVMPYNVGGPRTNSQFRWFVGSNRTVTLASGKEVQQGFSTILGSFGQKQAKAAVDELNNITAEIRRLLEEQSVDNIGDLKLTKAQEEELGDFIRANNKWDPEVTDLADLQRIAEKKKFTFTEKFAGKARDERVSIGDDIDDTHFGMSVGESHSTRLNEKRGDTVLKEYGGALPVNASPAAAMADQFGSETFGYANRAASQNAVVSWVKLAETTGGAVTFPTDVGKNDYLGRFLGAKVSKTGGYDDITAQLREQQDVIKRRLNQPTWLSDKWEVATTQATEFIFGATGKKVDLTGSDPASRLMQVGFYSKFGFLNIDQFVLQSLHSLTVAAISPIHGSKAVGMATPLLVITKLKDGPTRALAIKRMAKLTKPLGLDEAELTDMVDWISQSGRNIVDDSIVELQGPQKYGASSNLLAKGKEAAGGLLDKSTVFFKEGERASRMVGLVTAYLEHRAKRPNESPMSDEGLRWLTNREQDLTFRMTSQSKNLVTGGPARVPAQWLSFTMAAMENVIVGRNFTAGERARMALAMGPMFGLTGIGAGHMTGYVVEKMGYEADDPDAVNAYNNLKFGFMDQALSYLLGTETAYATRVAPIDQVFDVFRGFKEDSVLETLFGPSGSIVNDIRKPISNALGYIMTEGSWELLKDDAIQVARNISTVDKIYKIREIVESGNYMSKTSKVAVSGMETNDALSVAFGATPAPVQNFYDFKDIQYKETAIVKETRTRLQQKARVALNLLNSGSKDDMIRGDRMWEAINAEISLSPLSKKNKASITRSLVTANDILDLLRTASGLTPSAQFEARILNQQVN